MPSFSGPIKPGEIRNPKGAPKGIKLPGRPPNYLRELIRDIVYENKAWKRYKKIINDAADAEEKVTDQGVCVPTRAKAATYVQALELGLNYAIGKPKEDVTLHQVIPEDIRKTIELTNKVANGDGEDEAGTTE